MLEVLRVALERAAVIVDQDEAAGSEQGGEPVEGLDRPVVVQDRAQVVLFGEANGEVVEGGGQHGGKIEDAGAEPGHDRAPRRDGSRPPLNRAAVDPRLPHPVHIKRHTGIAREMRLWLDSWMRGYFFCLSSFSGGGHRSVPSDLHEAVLNFAIPYGYMSIFTYEQGHCQARRKTLFLTCLLQTHNICVLQ